MSWPAIFARGALFLIIWSVLTGGAADSWWIGVLAVALALLLTLVLSPDTGFSWMQFLRFLPFFLLLSLQAGATVARCIIRREMAIQPGLICYRMRLRAGLPQVFMTNVINLLPGTLSADIADSVLTVHVLDTRSDFWSELATVERHVGLLFPGAAVRPNGGDVETTI